MFFNLRLIDHIGSHFVFLSITNICFITCCTRQGKRKQIFVRKKEEKKGKRGFMMNSSLSNCGPTSKHVSKPEKRRCVFKDKQQSEIKSVKNDVINSSVFL